MATKKYNFSVFPIHKSKGPNLTLPTNRSRSNPGHLYVNFKELTPQMLHTKFQGNRPSGSEEEHFLRFLPDMGMVAILAM